MTSSGEKMAWSELYPGAATPSPPALHEAVSWLPELAGFQGRGAGGANDEADEAYARGYAAGVALAEEQGRKQVAAGLHLLESIAETLRTSADEFARDRVHNLEALALAVARKLVQRELSADDSLLRSLVERALELLPPEEPVEVRLHPDDLAVVRKVDPESREGSHAGVLWTPDPGIEPGGFVVETPFRVVDGRTETALRALFDRFDHE